MIARLVGGICVLLATALVLGSFLASDTLAQEESEAPPAAQIVNDEGGAVRISGIVNYTAPYFTIGVAQPLVILEDQAGFVDRNCPRTLGANVNPQIHGRPSNLRVRTPQGGVPAVLRPHNFGV